MVFDIKGKIALITGGANGLGLEFAKALLRNGLRAVSLVDINSETGNKALSTIPLEFGPDRAAFFKADVSDIIELEGAFKETIEYYEQLDIVFNNAGILNDSTWQKEINININGVIHGMRLALEKYLPKYQRGSEGLIVNISSVAIFETTASLPIYSATKWAITGLTRCWGQEVFYNQLKVRVIAICPGITLTSLIGDLNNKSLGDIYEEHKYELGLLPKQTPEDVAKESMEVVKYAPNGSIWVIEGGESAYQYIFPDRSTMKNNVISKYQAKEA